MVYTGNSDSSMRFGSSRRYGGLSVVDRVLCPGARQVLDVEQNLWGVI